MFDDVPLGMHGSCTYIVEALTAAPVRNHRTEMSERERELLRVRMGGAGKRSVVSEKAI